MVGEDAEKVMLGVGVVVVGAVVFGVAKMLPPMGSAPRVATPDQAPAVANFAPTPQISLSPPVSGPAPRTYLWTPPAPADPPAAPLHTSAAIHTAAATRYTSRTLPVLLPDTVVRVPLPPPTAAPSPHASSPNAISAPGWYHVGPSSPLWVTSIRLHQRGETIGDHPVLGSISGARGVWLYDVTVYNNSPDTIYVVPADLTFSDHSRETLFPWNGQWSPAAGGNDGGGKSAAGKTAATRLVGSIDVPYCPGVSAPCVSLGPAYTTIAVYAENGGAVNSPTDGSLRTASLETSAVRPRQPLALRFIELTEDQASSLNRGWQPQSGPKGHSDLVSMLEKDNHATGIEFPIPVDAAPSFPV